MCAQMSGKTRLEGNPGPAIWGPLGEPGAPYLPPYRKNRELELERGVRSSEMFFFEGLDRFALSEEDRPAKYCVLYLSLGFKPEPDKGSWLAAVRVSERDKSYVSDKLREYMAELQREVKLTWSGSAGFAPISEYREAAIEYADELVQKIREQGLAAESFVAYEVSAAK